MATIGYAFGSEEMSMWPIMLAVTGYVAGVSYGVYKVGSGGNEKIPCAPGDMSFYPFGERRIACHVLPMGHDPDREP